MTTALTPFLLLGQQGGAGAAGPAVAYTNGTFGAFGGSAFDLFFGAAEGRLTFPLGPSTGAQVDGFVGTIGGDLFAQLSGHAFWRDPSVGLFGAYAAYNHQGGTYSYDTGRFGGEAEVYFNNFTVSAVAGVVTGSGSSSNFFMQSRLAAYLTPNTKVYGGYLYEGQNIANAGFEHMFGGTGLAVFGEGRVGENDYRAVWIGFRRYFGNDSKSLMAREREDVAPLWLHLVNQAEQVVPNTTPAPTSTTTTTTTTTTSIRPG